VKKHTWEMWRKRKKIGYFWGFHGKKGEKKSGVGVATSLSGERKCKFVDMGVHCKGAKQGPKRKAKGISRRETQGGGEPTRGKWPIIGEASEWGCIREKEKRDDALGKNEEGQVIH